MSGCTRVLAIVLALLFVITFPLALFVANGARLLTDRGPLTAALRDEQGVQVAIRQAVTDGFLRHPLYASLPPYLQDPALISVAAERVITDEFIAAQADAAVGSAYDFLETGDAEQLVLEVPTAPIVEAVRGPAGRDLVAFVVRELPPCPEFGAPAPPPGMTLALPQCRPALVSPEAVVNSTHGILVAFLDQQVAAGAISPTIAVDVLSVLGDDAEAIRRASAEVQRLYEVARALAWLVWLFPLACLVLILFLAVRSPGDFALWWGIPLAAGGALALLMAPVARPVGQRLIRDQITARLTAAGAPFGHSLLLDSLLELVAAAWFQQTLLVAGLVLIAGSFLAGLGVLGRLFWGRR